MAARPALRTDSLPPVSEDHASATASPARGKEMRSHLFNKLRVPELVHSWEFWHEKPGDNPASNPQPTPNQSAEHPASSQSQPPPQEKYSVQLSPLLTITDVKAFWSLFNNFEFAALPSKTSVHLFHTHVRPLWEDQRNARGGAWNFRVAKSQAVDFWREICMMAIGNQLQHAVESTAQQKGKSTFRDDVCGVSFRPKFASTIISVWNRDADHAAGREALLKTIAESLPDEMKPKDGTFYYKKHAEQEGFDREAAGLES